MKKAELFELARGLASAYQIDLADMCISHAAALSIHRLRRAPNRLDLSLTPEGWKRACLCYNPSPDAKQMEVSLFPALIVLHQNPPGLKSVVINDLQVQSIDSFTEEAKVKGRKTNPRLTKPGNGTKT